MMTQMSRHGLRVTQADSAHSMQPTHIHGHVPTGGTLLFFVGFLVPQNQIPKYWWW